MKPYRANRRPGNRAMTPAESARVVAAKWDFGCVPCLVWARAGNMPLADVAMVCEYDHKKSGNIRRGHRFGYAACPWHHRQVVADGWNHAHMRSHFGPSLMDGSRLFRETYGDDDFLIALQDELLTGEIAA
jgi:hypothetical protein